MTKEQFIALGITEDLATKAADSSATELKTYIPKHRFDEVTEENKTLKGTVRDNEKALEDLKKSTGDAETLKKQIETLQNDNAAKDEKYQKELSDRDFNSLLESQITSTGAKNAKTVKALLDIEALRSSKNQTEDIKAALEATKTENDYLFKAAAPEVKPGFVPIGGNPPATNQPGQRTSMKDAITAQIQAQQK